MDRKIGGFSPDLGLEDIGWLAAPESGLPAQRETQLTGEPIRHWVGELFQPVTLDQTLRRFARASVTDPALLTPARFESVVRDSARELGELGERHPDPCLAEAADLLEHELRLRDLLTSYRGLLMRA